MDTDKITTEIITRPLRAADREKLLRSLVAAKEIDKLIISEVEEALKLCSICRDNRNLILHGAGGPDGEFADATLDHVTRVCTDFSGLASYLSELDIALTRVIYERTARETPIEQDGYSDDELLPDIVFQQPQRPARPRRLQHRDIRREVHADG